MILPDYGGMEVEQLAGELPAGAGQKSLRFERGVLEGAVVIARALPLAIIPMGHGVDRLILRRPRGEFRTDLLRNLVEWHERLAAMLADQSRLADIPCQQRQCRGATARRFKVRARRCRDPFVPDLAFVALLRRQSVRAEQRVGLSPGFALELAKRLGQPAGQR